VATAGPEALELLAAHLLNRVGQLLGRPLVQDNTLVKVRQAHVVGWNAGGSGLSIREPCTGGRLARSLRRQ
jgi:hypothetical protein